MKSSRIIALFICMIMMCSVAFANTAAGANTLKLQIGNPVMTVDGADAEIDPGRGTVPVVESGRTLVPIRAIIEALGGSVGWNDEKQEVTLTYNSDVIKLVINSDKAYFNNEESTLDVAPTTINERTMLPIRYVAESFNFDVQWDGETSTVTISKKATAQENPTPPTGEDSFDVFTDPSDLIEEETAEGEEPNEINPEDEEELIPEEEEEITE